MFKKSRISAAALIAIGAAMPAVAQDAQKLERIEITGSRIKTISTEGASPVAVIGEAEIKADGVRNVESFMNNLPQVFADQGGTVSNGSTGTATVNLRGLGASRTLVLINGRRMNMGSSNIIAPDLNQIPAALIKRVEVLTGGASAIYGSDAVAGVVNFIMNDRFEGVQLDVNHSFFQHNQQNPMGVATMIGGRAATNPAQFKVPGDVSADGKSSDISLLMGANFADNKGNATLFFGYKNDDELLQADRDFSACTLGVSGGNTWVCGGSGTNATGRITALTGPNAGRVYTVANNQGLARAYNGATDAYNFGPLNHYQRPSERYTVRAAANYDVSDKAKVYGEFNMHDDLTVAQIAPGGAFGSIHTVKYDNPLLSQSWRDALGLVKPGDEAEFVLQRRNVEGGGRQSQFRNTSFRGVAGVKGDVGAWNYDAYLIRGKVISSQSANNYFLNQRIDAAMDVVNQGGKAVCANGDAACVPYNIWTLGGVTPAQLAYLQVPGMQKGSTSLGVAGLTVSADLTDYGIKLPTSRNGVGVALGVEHRKDSLENTTDAATEAGDLSGSGGPTKPIAGSVSVKEIFGELRLPIVEKQPWADLLSANISARHSSYSTGISTDTYGLGLEYAPVREAKVRGTYSRAVRAPNIIELFQAQDNALFDMDADPCGGATPTASREACARTGVTAAQYGNIQNSPADQYNYLAGGNPQLKPETANSMTLGLVLQPMRDLSMTVDYFDIKVEDTISNVSPETILRNCLDGLTQFCGLIKRDQLGTLWLLPEGKITATNDNLGTLRTKGFDLGANYTHRLGAMGTLNLSYIGTVLNSLEIEPVKGRGSYDCAGYYGPSKCGAPNAKYRHKIRGTWVSPYALDVAVTWRHIASVDVQTASSNPLLTGPTNAIERTLGARNYLDVAANWRPMKGLTLTAGINNLLDKDPPLSSQMATGVGNGNTYPGVYDSFGRKVFLGASYKF